MSGNSKSRLPPLSRRAALLLPLGVAGCSWFDDFDFFNTKKPPLPGKREAVLATGGGLEVMADGPKVVLPTPIENAAWPQAGGNPAHVMQHLAAGPRLSVAWSSSIGDGGGYRKKITAQPVIGGGRVFVMDSDGTVGAFDMQSGNRIWRTGTQDEDNRSTNVGGGLALEGDAVYASTGRAEILALDAASGKINWRRDIPGPARSAPTIAEGRIFVNVIADQAVALALEDGQRIWGYNASPATTPVLGQPAPAYSEGLVVAGFGSGELAGLRAVSGAVAWTDGLGAGRGRTQVGDLSAVRGLPVVLDGVVYAMSLGGLTVALDLRSGRRLWERNAGGTESPWLAGDWLFAITNDQQLAVFNRNDGRVPWLTDLPRYEDEKKKDGPIYWRGPLLAGDRLIVVGSNKEALAVSPYTGEILGRQDLPGPASVSPVIAAGTVFIVTDDASLLALR